MVGKPLLQMGPMVADFPFKMGPIIEPGAAAGLGVDLKAKRSNEPQLGPDRDAGSPHGAGVGGDFWFVEHNVQQRLIFHCAVDLGGNACASGSDSPFRGRAASIEYTFGPRLHTASGMEFINRYRYAFGLALAIMAGLAILAWSGLGDSNGIAQIPPERIKFDGDRSYAHLVDICKIGGRVSGSPGMAKQQKMIIDHFKALGGKVIEQDFTGRNPSTGARVNLKNIIVQWFPDRKERILIGCHYDTRPFPDQDPLNPRGVFVGANDGASGVALMMELGRYMPDLRSRYGVDFVFFDAEELVYKDGDPYFLGSEYFAKQYRATPPPYSYKAGIIVDMVADRELHIFQEKASLRLARGVVKDVWQIARALRIEEFVHRSRHNIRDDHLALNTIAGIPTIDIIDFDYPRPGGPNYWHTMQDIPENCSGESLEKVGKVVHAWLIYLR